MIYISINGHTIRANAKHGRNDPPIRIATSRSGKPVYAREVEITGNSTLVYSPECAILKCGARLVLCVPPPGKVRISK